MIRFVPVFFLVLSFSSFAQKEETNFKIKNSFVELSSLHLFPLKRANYHASSRFRTYSPGVQMCLGLKFGEMNTKCRISCGYQYVSNSDFKVVSVSEMDTLPANTIHDKSILIPGDYHAGLIKIGLESGLKHQFRIDLFFGLGTCSVTRSQGENLIGYDHFAFEFRFDYNDDNGSIAILNKSIEKASYFTLNYGLEIGYCYYLNSGVYFTCMSIFSLFHPRRSRIINPSLGLNCGIGYSFGSELPSIKSKSRFKSI